MLFYNATFLLCIVYLHDELPSGIGESLILYFSVAAVLCLLGLVGTVKVRHRQRPLLRRLGRTGTSPSTSEQRQLTSPTAIPIPGRYLCEPCPPRRHSHDGSARHLLCIPHQPSQHALRALRLSQSVPPAHEPKLARSSCQQARLQPGPLLCSHEHSYGSCRLPRRRKWSRAVEHRAQGS